MLSEVWNWRRKRLLTEIIYRRSECSRAINANVFCGRKKRGWELEYYELSDSLSWISIVCSMRRLSIITERHSYDVFSLSFQRYERMKHGELKKALLAVLILSCIGGIYLYWQQTPNTGTKFIQPLSGSPHRYVIISNIVYLIAVTL